MKATEVTAGLAESNGSLLPGLWRDSPHVTCGLTACTPGSAPCPTLGNEYGKLYLFLYLYSHCNLRKFSFCSRVVNIWNSLRDSVVDADTLNTFKSRLDKHCLNQDVLYNFHSDLTGTGGASIRMWCCKRYGQRGIPAPVYSHWIGLVRTHMWQSNIQVNYPNLN